MDLPGLEPGHNLARGEQAGHQTEVRGEEKFESHDENSHHGVGQGLQEVVQGGGVTGALSSPPEQPAAVLTHHQHTADHSTGQQQRLAGLQWHLPAQEIKLHSAGVEQRVERGEIGKLRLQNLKNMGIIAHVESLGDTDLDNDCQTDENQNADDLSENVG